MSALSLQGQLRVAIKSKNGGPGPRPGACDGGGSQRLASRGRDERVPRSARTPAPDPSPAPTPRGRRRDTVCSAAAPGRSAAAEVRERSRGQARRARVACGHGLRSRRPFARRGRERGLVAGARAPRARRDARHQQRGRAPAGRGRRCDRGAPGRPGPGSDPRLGRAGVADRRRAELRVGGRERDRSAPLVRAHATPAATWTSCGAPRRGPARRRRRTAVEPARGAARRARHHRGRHR